jgi:hypothetical protein
MGKEIEYKGTLISIVDYEEMPPEHIIKAIPVQKKILEEMDDFVIDVLDRELQKHLPGVDIWVEYPDDHFETPETVDKLSSTDYTYYMSTRSFKVMVTEKRKDYQVGFIDMTLTDDEGLTILKCILKKLPRPLRGLGLDKVLGSNSVRFELSRNEITNFERTIDHWWTFNYVRSSAFNDLK